MSTPMRYFLIGVPTENQRQVSDARSYVSIDKLIGLGGPYSSSESEYSPSPAVAFERMISRPPDNSDYSSPPAFTAVETVSCPSKSKYARPAYVADKYTQSESYFRQRAQDVRVVDCHSAGCSSPGGSTDSPTNACVIAGNESVAGEVRMTPMVDQHIETMYVSRDPPISKVRYGDNQCYVLATDRLTTNQPTPPLPNLATSNNKDNDIANASDEQPLDLTKPKRLPTSINRFPMDGRELTDCSTDEIPRVATVGSKTLYDQSINTNGRSGGSTADNGHTYLNSNRASFMENVLASHTSRNAKRNNNASHVSTNDEVPKIRTTQLSQRRIMSQASDAEQMANITLNDVNINVNIVQSDKPRGNSNQTQTISISSEKPVPNNTKRRKKGHQCPHCPKAFPLPWKLKIHIRIHTGEKPFQCETCGKRFSVRCNLRDHLQLHTGDRRWPCKQCSAKFSWPSQLKAHQRVHSGERPYLCRYCPMTFAWSSSKNHHERGHTGEKNFPCTKCSRKYHRKSALDTHRRNHHGHHEHDEGLKSFVCSHCNQAFSYKTSLTKHLRKHTGEKPYRCLECSARFDTLRAFHKHRNLSHSPTHPFVCELCLVNFHTESDLKDHNIILHSPITEEQDASRKKGSPEDHNTILHSPVTEEQDASRKKGSQESKLNTGIQSGDTNDDDDDDNKTMDETCVDAMEIDTTNIPRPRKLLNPLPFPDKSSRCLNSSRITRSIACHSHQEEMTSPSVKRHKKSKKSKEKQGNIKDASIGNKASLGMIKTNTTKMVADDVSQIRLTQLNSDQSDTSGQMLPNLHLDPRDENSHVTYQQESPHVIGWYPKKVVLNSNGNITDMRNGAPINRGNQDKDGTRLDKADTKNRDDLSIFDKSNSILARLFGQATNEYPLHACQVVGKESGPLCEPDNKAPHRNQSLDAEVGEILPGNTDRKSETASFLEQLLTVGRVNTLNDKEYLSNAEEGCSHPAPGELNTKTRCHLGNSLNNGKSVKLANLTLNSNLSGQRGNCHDKYNGCTVDNKRARYFGLPLPCGRGQQAEKNISECSTCKEIFSCHEVLQAHIISRHRHLNVYEMSKIGLTYMTI